MITNSDTNQLRILDLLSQVKRLLIYPLILIVNTFKLLMFGLSRILFFGSSFLQSFKFTLLGLIALTCLFEITTLSSVKAQDPSVWIYQYSRGLTSGPTTFSEAPSKGKIFFYIWTSSGSTNAMVNYSVTQVGDFLTDSTVTSSNQTKQVTGSVEDLEFAITDDNIDEPDGSITVTLLAGPGYILSQTQSHPKSITIAITDNDAPPVINLEAPASPVVAGNNARFTLTTSMNSKWSEAFDVQIAVTERVGNFVEDNSWPTTVNFGTNLTDNAITKNYDFTTIVADDNDIFTSSESTGSVEVTISPDTNGRVNYTIGTGVLTRYIVSEDIPIAAISAPSASVSEGETASLPISVTGKWESEIAVEVELEDGSRGLIGSPAPNTTIRFSANPAGTPQTKIFSFPISLNDIFSTTNQILISIKTPTRSSSYQVIDDSQSTGTTNRSSVTITVAELSNPPKIEIIVPTIPIQSGNLASIPIKATGKWTDPFSIPVTISNQVGDYFTGLSYPPNVAFTKNTSENSVTKFYNFQLALGGFGNTFGTYEGTEIDGSFSIELTEDTTNTPKRYELMTQSKQLIVVNRDKPTISVSIPDEMVKEGDTANFSITAIGFWTNEFSVQVNVDDNNTNTIGSAPPMTVTFDANTTEFTVSKMYPVNTLDDDIDEMNGEVTVTIELPDNAAYTISNLYSHTESKTILDNGPLITIESVNSYVTHGQLAQFRVNANSNLIDDTTIQVNVSQSSCISGTPDEEVIIKQGESNGLLEILTTTGSNDCEITATLESGEHYKIGTSNTVATIMTGSEVIYTVSISTGMPIIEGADAKFTISTTPIPQQTFTLNYNVSQIGNFILWRVKNSINLNTETSDTTLTIKTHNDEIRETNGSISVKIFAGTGFQLGAKNLATLTVMDNDQSAPSTPQSRISIAHSAVNAILNLNRESSPSSQVQTTNSPSVQNMKFNQDLIRPKVSIYSLKSTIAEGSLAQFHIHASEKISRTININLNVQDNGNFINGSAPQTIQLSPTNSPYLVSIETKDDTEATPDGMISIEILTGEDYVVGDSNNATVIVSDLNDRLRAEQVESLNQRVMSQLFSSVSERSVSTISNRLHYANDLVADPTFKFGNSHSLSSFLSTNGELLNNNSNSWYSLLDDASFLIPLNPEGRGDRSATIWGHGDYLSQTLSSSQFARSATGEGYVGNLGLDAQLGNYAFTGIAVSGSRIESTYEFNEIGSINYDSQLTILSPYVKFTNSAQNAYLSAIFGIGSGATTINEAEGISTTQSNRIASATLIGNQPIYSFTNTQQQSSGELSISGQTGWQVHNLNYVDNQNSVSEVNRNLQIGTTATYEQKLVNAGSVDTTLSYGMVGDHRDGKTILSQELTNDINVTHQSGLSLSLASEFAFTPTTQGHRTAISGSLAFDRHQDDVGLMIELTPTWVKAEGQVVNSQSNDNFLVAGDREGTDPSNSMLTTKLSFGLPIFDATSLVTPYTAYELVAGEEPQFDVGVSMQAFNNLQMTLNYRQTPTYSKRHDLRLRSNLKW